MLRKFGRKYKDFFAVIIVLLLKVMLFSYGIQLASREVIFCSLAIILMLASISLLLPYLARIIWLLGLDLLVSFILLADSLFFRFFHSVITVPVLLEAGEVEGVTSSIMTLFSVTDFLFFLDFLILIPYFKKLIQKPSKPSPILRRVGQVAIILLICGLSLDATAKNAFANFDSNQFLGVTWNQTVLRNLGVVNFHLYDVYSYVKQKNTQGEITDEVPQLKAWMAEHIQQGDNQQADSQQADSQQATLNLNGAAKGKNVIIIQMEAMQGFLVGRSVDGQEVTPNLNQLIDKSLYFDNYFTQIGQGNTSDAEFMTLNSLYPAPTGSNYVLRSDNTYDSLPTVLAGSGYQGSYVFHANTADFWNRSKMYQAEGITTFFNDDNFFQNEETVGMGLSDQSMFSQVIPQLQKLPQPYLSLVISLSGHYPYTIPEAKQGLKISEGEYSTIFSDYLQAQHYADQALGEFISQLKAKGIWDNSVVVIYGDHYGTGWTNEDLTTFLGTSQELNTYGLDELNKVPLVIHLPGDQAASVKHISGGQMDLYPTLLNLLGIDNQNKFFFGQDLLNAQSGFSAFRVWAPDGSFATDQVFYLANLDGNFADGTAYDRKTGQEIGLDGLEDLYNQALWEIRASDLILQTNGLGKLIEIP